MLPQRTTYPAPLHLRIDRHFDELKVVVGIVGNRQQRTRTYRLTLQ